MGSRNIFKKEIWIRQTIIKTTISVVFIVFILSIGVLVNMKSVRIPQTIFKKIKSVKPPVKLYFEVVIFILHKSIFIVSSNKFDAKI